MEIRGKHVLVLGGWGLVGQAICREVMVEEPAQLVVCSLLRQQAKEAMQQLRLEYPGSPTRLHCEWGNIFACDEDRGLTRGELLANPEKRARLLSDIYDELTPEILHGAYAYRLLERFRPEIIIDCVNVATALAYQDAQSSTRRVLSDLRAARDNGTGVTDDLISTIERHLLTSSVPQLIRHVQVLYKAMLDVNTKIYLKIGTSGTGGMGLNIPYTHSEEKPSGLLLSKSAVAGAHSLLLFLMARTPEGPIIKEFKPTAAIAWKKIEHGTVRRSGEPIRLHSIDIEDAVRLEGCLDRNPPPELAEKLDASPPRHLESVFVDAGENGLFSVAEFEAITTIGQMEYITPEEIARNCIFEIKGGNTGHDIVNSLDQACMGPTYRAGAMRAAALERMRALERKHEVDSIAFEMLGPPKLSKFLYEAYLLRRCYQTFEGVLSTEAERIAQDIFQLISSDDDLRSRIVSIGIPVLLPDGVRLLRGREIKIPPDRGLGDPEITPEAIDRWAAEGWVDLREANWERWRERLQVIVDDVARIPANDTSSRYDADNAFWFGPGVLEPGKLAGWLFIREEKGLRMKS